MRSCHLRAWAHTAGYRGHCLTKSRRFSTTFAALRANRQEWQVDQKRAGATNWLAMPGPSTTQMGSSVTWTFVGMGYTTPGDAWLAESIAEEERLARRSTYEERQDELVGGSVTRVGLADDLISIPEAARRVGLARRHPLPAVPYRAVPSGASRSAPDGECRYRVLERYLHADARDHLEVKLENGPVRSC
jgi:hypothetical protein